MKNKFTVLLALSLVLLIAGGCGIGSLIGSDESSSTKETTSKSTESGSNNSKTEKAPSGEIVEIGIKECDELATYINDNAEEISNEGIVVRGIVEYVKQSIFSNLRDSVKNMTEEQKTTAGENCKKALENLKKSMSK